MRRFVGALLSVVLLMSVAAGVLPSRPTTRRSITIA